MTPATLLLVLVAVGGIYAFGRSLRLAPLVSEFPLSTLAATVLAGAVAMWLIGASGATAWPPPPHALVVVVAVVGVAHVFGPPLLVALVRAGRSSVATRVLRLLYRSPSGAASVGRLLGQAAVQVGDPVAARELFGFSSDSSVTDSREGSATPVALAQVLRLERDWQGVLDLGKWPVGDGSAGSQPARQGRGQPAVVGNEWLLAEARIEALVELDRLPEAEGEVRAMSAAFEAEPASQTPLAFRTLNLSRARLAAAHGDFEGARAQVQQPMVGVGPATLYGILGRAADRAGARDVAVKLYTQACAEARGRPRGFYEAEVVRLGGTVPPPTSTVARTKTPVTLVMVAVIAAAYGAQVLVDRLRGVVSVLGQHMDTSSVIAAYVQGIPGLPAAGAWWRYLSYAFLHGNLLHVGFNLWVLFDIGRMYERRRGWGDLVAAFTLGTAAGAWLTSVMQAGQPLVLVGASGGILGLAGALLADALFGRRGPDMTLVRSLLQWMALILLFSMLPGVSLWGHAGGVLGGFVYGAVRGRLPLRVVGRALGAVAAGLLIVAVATAVTTIVPLLP